MLDKKIINIKNILKIIISILIIASMTKSCAKAWTWNDWIDYLGQLQERDDVPSAWKTKINKFLLHENDFETVAGDYSNFYFNMDAGDPTIWYWNTPITVTQVNTNINYAPIKFNTMWMAEAWFYNSLSQGGTNRTNFSRYPGLIEVPESIEVQFDNNMWFQNKYDRGFTYDPVGVTAVNYNGYQGLLAKKVNSNSITLGTLTKPVEAYKYYRFILLDENANKIGYLDWNSDNDYYSSQNIYAFLPPLSIWIERRTINLNQIYTLTIYAADEPINNSNTNIDDSQVYTYIFLPQNAVISNGTITNTGSGDDYTVQDSTNDNLNFWQETINNIFDVSGESVRNKVENFYQEIGYSSGDVSGELQEALAGLDVINGNFGDFKISWNSFNPNLTVKGTSVQNQKPMIPSGEVNFSKFERENPIMQEVMRYVRAILSFSIFVMLGKNFWNTLMLTLGISPAVYDKATEESRTAKQNEEKWQQQLEKQRYNEWLRTHRNRK